MHVEIFFVGLSLDSHYSISECKFLIISFFKLNQTLSKDLDVFKKKLSACVGDVWAFGG